MSPQGVHLEAVKRRAYSFVWASARSWRPRDKLVNVGHIYICKYMYVTIYVYIYMYIIIYICMYITSTAQGGGGSFKNRKPIGEIGCCDSWMAERIHWWTERCLRSSFSFSFSDYLPTSLSLYLSISLSLYLSISLSLYLSIYLSTYLSIYLSTYLPIYLSTYLPIYLSTYLPVYLSTCLPVYLSTCLPVYLSTCLPVYLSTCLPVPGGTACANSLDTVSFLKFSNKVVGRCWSNPTRTSSGCRKVAPIMLHRQ